MGKARGRGQSALGATRQAALGPDSPFAGLIGAGRRAARRRTVLRRVIALLTILAAATLALTQISSARQAGAAAAATSTEDLTSGNASVGGEHKDESGDLGDLAGAVGGAGSGAAAGEPDSATSGTGSRAADAGTTTGETDSNDRTTTRGQRGAEALPAGRVGVVVGIDEALAARLRVGDQVDVYAVGTGQRVARGAHVVDVTRPGDGSAEDPAASAWASGGASVFLAVSTREVARIPAGQSAGSGPDAFFLTVTPRDNASTSS